MGLSLWGEEILTEKAASFPICLVYRWNFPHRSRIKHFPTLKFDYRPNGTNGVVLKSNKDERIHNGTILPSCPM